MPRKESITRDILLEAAFEMTREEGFSEVTARKVATKTGCSTQPIFRVYRNMDELCDEVYEKGVSYFQDYYSLYPRTSNIPFVNLGMAYISFAREERNLFKLLFVNNQLQKKNMYELLNGANGNVVKEINLARIDGCKDPGGLFSKMWIFIHGAACMSLTGDYDLSDVETKALMEQAYQAFLSH